MRLFTDPVFSCNSLLWRIQIIWHPAALVLLVAGYQVLSILINGLQFLTLSQLHFCLVIWLEVTCWFGLLAPSGLLLWVFGGFLYRQTGCKIFALDQCSNSSWHSFHPAGVSVRCALGTFFLGHLYPTIWCLSTGRGSVHASLGEKCQHTACDLVSRMEIWLAFAGATSITVILGMHWLSWWSMQSLWRYTTGGFACEVLSLALSQIVSIGAAAAVLVVLDPKNALEHTLQVSGCFFLVACLGTWSRFLQKRSGGWLPPLLTATTTGVLAFALSARAIEWYHLGQSWQDLQEAPVLGNDAAVDCMVLRVSRNWLLWAQNLDQDARKFMAVKARSLMTCATTLPACVLTFLSAVQFRGKRVSPDSGVFCSAMLGVVGALLGFVFNVLLYLQRPNSPRAFALEVARWLAPSGLGVVAGAALKCYWEPSTNRCCLSCTTHAALVLGLVSAYLATALLFSRLDFLQLRSFEDISDFIRQDLRLEAVHIILFLATMILISYIGRSAYWRRHWDRRWQSTPLDHQGLYSAQRMNVIRGASKQWQWAYDAEQVPREETVDTDDFWLLGERLSFGRRARMLRLQLPLCALNFWEKLRLYRQSLVLTVQATTSSVWNHTFRVGDVRGFAPAVVAQSQVMSLCAPALLARACRLLIIIYLWYCDAGHRDRMSQEHKKDAVAWELRFVISDSLQKDLPGPVPEEGATLSQLHQVERTWSTWLTSAARMLHMKGDVAVTWFVGPSSPYEYSLIANVLVSLVLAVSWRSTGLFTLTDSLMQGVMVFIDSDSQCRKAILLRDGALSPLIKVAWLIVTLIAQCLLPLHTILQSRYWLNPCGLLDVLLQQGLIPISGHLIAVSGADMKDGLIYNSMLNDSALVQSAALAISSALTMLGNSGATLTDLFLFALQMFFKAIKGPLDAHSLRLMRMRAIADAIEKQRNAKIQSVWGMEGKCVRWFAGVERVGGVDMEAISWIELPKELRLEDGLHSDIGWSVAFTEVPTRIGWWRMDKRLAIHISIPDPDLWVVWTLQLEGRHRWFRRVDEELRSSSDESPGLKSKTTSTFSLEGQWSRWYAYEFSSSSKDVFRVELNEMFRPGTEERLKLEAQGERRFGLRDGRVLEVNDWGLLQMSDGTRWVRSGPEGLMEGTMYGNLRFWTRYDSLSDTTAFLTFQSTSRSQTLRLKGRWTEEFHWFEVSSLTKVSIGEDAFRIVRMQFHPGAISAYVQYDHSIKPVRWTMYPKTEKVETFFTQTFTGESVGGDIWHPPAVTYPSWWWSKLRRQAWEPPIEGHACMADTRDIPRFIYHKGPGRLIAHHDPEAREAVNKRDMYGSSYFLGNDMVQVDKLTLTLHACTRAFRPPTCNERMDLAGRYYAAAAEGEGFKDDLDELSSPLELHAKLWPEIDRTELSDDDVSGYVQVGSPREQGPFGQRTQPRALMDA